MQLCGFESRSRHVNLDQAFFDLMLFENISTEIVLFFILYGITGVVPFIAAVYLFFRRANAIMPGVTPPVRLRCWTISFFALITLAHVWWLLFYICYGDMSSDIYASDMSSKIYLVCVMLDSVLLFTTLAGTLLAMLQDRYRPVWPVLVAILPFVVFGSVFMVYPSELIEQLTNVYMLLLCLLFSVYMVFAIRQYGRWLNDNYADLENKKVWLIQVVSLVCMLMFVLARLHADVCTLYTRNKLGLDLFHTYRRTRPCRPLTVACGDAAAVGLHFNGRNTHRTCAGDGAGYRLATCCQGDAST